MTVLDASNHGADSVIRTARTNSSPTLVTIPYRTKESDLKSSPSLPLFRPLFSLSSTTPAWRENLFLYPPSLSLLSVQFLLYLLLFSSRDPLSLPSYPPLSESTELVHCSWCQSVDHLQSTVSHAQHSFESNSGCQLSASTSVCRPSSFGRGIGRVVVYRSIRP